MPGMYADGEYDLAGFIVGVVAAGGGAYHLAFIATAITIGSLIILHPLERVIARRFGGGGEKGKTSSQS